MLLLGLAAIVILFTILWAVSLRLDNSSIADVAWGPGILVVGLTYYFTGDGGSVRARLTLALVAIWAIRLAAHLYVRMRLQGQPVADVEPSPERLLDPASPVAPRNPKP